MAQKGKQVAQYSFLESLTKWIIVGIFAVLPLLYFSDRAASYVTSKEYFFIGAVDVLIVLWAWLLLQDKRYRLSKKNILFLAPLFLFLLALTISGIAGVDSSRSFFSIVESGTGLVLLYHAFLFACIIASFIRIQQKRILTTIIQGNLFASIVLAITTFFTGNSGVFEINSKMLDYSSGGAMMGNSLLVGAYFIFSIFLTIYLITHESKLWKKIIYWTGVAIMILSPIYFNAAIFKGKSLSSSYLFIGEARIAAVSLIIGLVTSLLIWLVLQKQNKIIRNIGLVGLVLGIIIGGYIIKEISTPTTSLGKFFVVEGGNRYVDWQEAVQGIEAKPLLGWGPENYHVVYQKYLDPVVFSPGHGNEVWALHPHNNSLEILINGGIIGFLCYLLVLTSVIIGIIQLYRKGIIDRTTTALLAGMLLAFVIQQQMIYDSIVSYVMFFSIIGIIAGLSSTSLENKTVIKNTGLMYVLGAGILIVMFPAWLYLSYLPAKKMDEFQYATTMTSDARTKVYDHLFNSPGSYAIDTDVEFFTDPLFYSYDPQKVALRSNPTYQKVASTEIQTLLATVNPIWQHNLYDYHLTLSLLQLENLDFYLTGNIKDLAQADIYAKRAFILSPTDPQIYNAYAGTLVYENNIAEAKIMLDKAISLNPNYQSALEFKETLK